jgi:trehalose 6-phosphate phosphatase
MDAPPVIADPLFFIDYDGTLAPIVDDPDAAVPHPEAPDVLQALDARYPLWIVTGRHLQALDDLLNLPLRAIGLHGAQEGRIGGTIQRLAPDDAVDALRRLRQTVPTGDGVQVEEKDTAFAIHYRAADDEAEARERIRSWADAVPDMLEAIWGKKVMELRPKGMSKGTAVRKVAADFPGRTPIYLGDDVTDEDAFAALADVDGAIPVKVGDGDTRAQYRLSGPSAVVEYLREYL